MWDSKIKTSFQERKYLIVAIVVVLVIVGVVVASNRGNANPESRTTTSFDNPTASSDTLTPPPTITPTPEPAPSPAPAPVPQVNKDLNALYIGTAMNSTSGREEEAVFFYNSDDYTDSLSGTIYFLDSVGEGNFDRMIHPRLVHQFNTQYKYRFFSWDRIEGRLVVSITRTGVNEIHTIDTSSNTVKKIWQRNLGDNKYGAAARGAGEAKLAAFDSDQYIFVFFDHKYLLVLNTVAGTEKFIGNYGDPQIDFENNKLTAAPFQPGDTTEPTGARQEFALP